VNPQKIARVTGVLFVTTSSPRSLRSFFSTALCWTTLDTSSVAAPPTTKGFNPSAAILSDPDKTDLNERDEETGERSLARA